MDSHFRPDLVQPYQEIANTFCPCCGKISHQAIGPVRYYERFLDIPVVVCYGCDPLRRQRRSMTAPGLVNAELLRKGRYPNSRKADS